MESKTIELSELGLSVRAFNAVHRLGIKDVRELRRRFQADPNKFRKECGDHHIREIAEALGNYYLRSNGSAVVMASEPEPEQDDGYFVEDAPDDREYIDAEPDKKARAIYLRDHVKAHLAAMQANLYEGCKAMKEMRDGKLYKQLGYQNFEDCCKAEFGLSMLEGVRAARKGGKIMRQCDREQLLGIQRRIERKLRLFEEKPRFFRIPDEKRMAYRAGYDAAAACMLAWARDQIAELLERLPADE